MTVPIPIDGRLTSLSFLSGPLTGTEVMYIVSPGSAALGNSYQVTLNVLATFFQNPLTVELTSGATIGSPYSVLTNTSRLLFNKSIASNSYAVLPLASSMVSTNGVLFKDLKGDANTHNIHITFTGGQLCDGLSEILIDTPYGWALVVPTPSGTAWYQA